MRKNITILVIVCLGLIISGAVTAWAQPQTVPRLTVRALDRASYVELAQQWKEYIEKHGESALALTNLGMAYDYSGEKKAAVIAARRAVEIEPDNPKALVFLAKLLSKYEGDDDRALELLQRCRTVAPGEGQALIELSAIYLRRGDLDRAEKIFKTAFDQKIFDRPLQDFAYNLLVGLPEGAVLITNGDNDTLPPLALQAGMGFRKDVTLINRSLLNSEDYEKAIFERYPSAKPRGGSETTGDLSRASSIIKRMVDDDKINVFFACSVSFEGLGFRPDTNVEGVTFRASKKGLTAEESALLFLETYRLDSATDWSYPWDLFPSTVHLLSNYVSGIVNLVYYEGDVSPDTKRKLLDKAMEIAEFHDLERLMGIIRSLQKK